MTSTIGLGALGEYMITMLSEKSAEIVSRVDGAMNLAAEHIQGEAQLLAPVGMSSGLKQSITVRQEGYANYIIGTDMVYAGAVEFGSRPHWAPQEPIKEWAEFRGIEDWYKIWLTIGLKGTQAHPFLRPAFHKYKQTTVELVQGAVREGLVNG